MLQGTRYRNDYDILTPDHKGSYVLYRYEINKEGEIDHVRIIGNRGGDSKKAFPLNDEFGRLSLRSNIPLKSYRYNHDRLVYNKHGSLKVYGKYPFFHDSNNRKVWIMPGGVCMYQPYDFVMGVQADARERVLKHRRKAQSGQLKAVVAPLPNSTYYEWVVRIKRNGKWFDLASGQGQYRSQCEHTAEQWITNYKIKLTERYKHE